MGDAYKGLTIRIGADTSRLDAAMRSVRTSARETQTHLGRLNRALKFDPGNTGAVSAAVGLIGDKARLSAVEANRLQTAISQVDPHVRDVAGRFGDVNAAVEHVRNNVKRTDRQLESFYDIARRAAATLNNITLDRADRQVKDLQRNLTRSGQAAEAARAEIRNLLTAGFRGRGGDEAQSLVGDLGYRLGDLDKMLSDWEKLHNASSRYKNDLKTANDARSFVNAKSDMAAADAELDKLAGDYARFKTSIGSVDLGEGFRRASQQAEVFDRNIDRARSALERASAAADDLPHSVEAARGKMEAMKAASSVVADKMSVVKEKIDRLSKEPGIERMAADSKRVYTEMAKAESEVKELKSQLAKAEAKAQGFADELEQAQQRGRGASNEIREAAIKLSQAEIDAGELASKLERAEANARNWTLATELREANAEMDSLLGKSKQLNTRQMGGGKTAINRFADSMKNVGYGLYSTITPGVMMAGSYIVNAANDVDSAYRDMRKTVNGTEDQFEALKNAAIDFSRTHVTSADTMLEIEAMGGQLGISAENLQAFGETVSSLDIATDMDANDIAESLGKMASVMGVNVDEYDNFGDSLVRLGNNMPVMESDIMNMTTRWMGMGKVVGMTADQMLGWSAAASATGMKPEAAGSAMQRFVSSVETAVTKGGDSLSAFAQVAGMSADEFASAFKTDASGALYSFVEGLGEIQKSGGSVNQTLSDLGFNNVRDKQLLEGLAQQMANGSSEANTLHDALKMSSDAYQGLSTVMADGTVEQAGDAAREAARKSEGFSGELAIMKNNATAMALEVGDGLVPIIHDLSGAFQAFTGWLQGLPDGAKTTVSAIALVGAAAGPFLVGINSVISAGSQLHAIFGKLPTGMLRLAAGTKVANTLSIAFKSVPADALAASGAIGSAASSSERMATGAGKAAAAAEGAAAGAANMAGNAKKAGTNASKAASGAEKLAGGSTRAAKAAENAAKGASGMAGSARAAGSAAVNAAAGAEQMAQKMTLAARAGSIFKASLGMAAAAVAVAAITGMIDAYMKYKKHAEDAAKASENMSDRMAKAAGAARGAMSEIGKAEPLKSGKEALEDYYGYLSDVADGYEVLQKKADEAFTNTGLIERYAATIEGLLQKTEHGAVLNPQEQAQLKAAVDAFNEAAGTSLSVTDAEKGKLQDLEENVYDTAAAFDKLADSKKFAALQGYANEEYATAYKKQYDAAKNLAEAQATYNEELRKYNELSESGPKPGQTYEEWQTALELQKLALDDAETAMWGYRDQIKGANEDMDQAAEMQSLMALAASDAATALDRLVAESPNVTATLHGNGQSAMDFVDALDSMGEAAQNLDADQVNELAAAWDGSLASILPKLEEYGIGLENLETMTIGDKTFYVTDNGTIYDAEGNLQKIQQFVLGDKTFYVKDDGTVWNETQQLQGLSTMMIGDKYFIVNDNGTIGGELADLQGLKSIQVGNKTYWVSDDGSVYDEQQKIQTLNDVTLANKFVHTDDDGTNKAVQNQIQTTNTNLHNLPGNTSVRVTGYGFSAVNSSIVGTRESLGRLDGKTASVYVNRYETTYRTTVRRADGGIAPSAILPRFARGALVPAHADGGINGIVTKATLTNVGWVGEAGAEAILNMRHAGGAIVPLSNRHYVRPFAQAVASEMGGGESGGSVTTTNVYIDGARVNDDAHIEVLFRDFMTYLYRKAAMNVG